jgi:hypothetical protein
MSTKDKGAASDVSALGFKSVEEFIAKCFPKAEEEPHLRRHAAKELGERWGQEALDLLRKQIESGESTTVAPIKGAEHAYALESAILPLPGPTRRPTVTARSHRTRKKLVEP